MSVLQGHFLFSILHQASSEVSCSQAHFSFAISNELDYYISKRRSNILVMITIVGKEEQRRIDMKR
jgi:hypothetical protein